MKKRIIAFSLVCMLAFTGCDAGSSSTAQSHNDVNHNSGNYIANRNSGKLHSSHCDSLPQEQNRIYFSSVEEANEAGYNDNHKECMEN